MLLIPYFQRWFQADSTDPCRRKICYDSHKRLHDCILSKKYGTREEDVKIAVDLKRKINSYNHESNAGNLHPQQTTCNTCKSRTPAHALLLQNCHFAKQHDPTLCSRTLPHRQE